MIVSPGIAITRSPNLAELNHILALKDLGFSLDQIEQVLKGLTAEQLQGMLIMKQMEVQQHLADEQSRLSRIRVRLKQLKMEDTMPDYDVVLRPFHRCCLPRVK